MKASVNLTVIVDIPEQFIKEEYVNYVDQHLRDMLHVDTNHTSIFDDLIYVDHLELTGFKLIIS